MFYPSVIWLHAHWFFAGFSIVGFVLFTVWAWKTLKGDKLKNLSIWLLAIGILGTLLTASPAMQGFYDMFNGMHGKYGMMNRMMDGDEYDQYDRMPMMNR